MDKVELIRVTPKLFNLKPQTLLKGCVCFVLKEDSEYFVMPTTVEKVSVETNTDRTKTSNRKVLQVRNG